MSSEEIERLAKYATDSYFNNLTENDKKYYMASKEKYINEYIKVFEIAKSEVFKKDNSKLEEFGKSFK